MKKAMILFISAVFAVSAAACSGGEKTEEASVSGTAPAVVHRESSEPSAQSSIPVSSEEESRLPDGVHKDKENFLRYTSPGKEVTAVFSDEFNTENTDYRPAIGIMLSNAEGSASLQIEAVKNQGITRSGLEGYLKENYPDSEIYITDNKQIVCKRKTKDSSGKEIMAYLKAGITDKGYNEAILFFKESEKGKYETVFNRITLS